MQPHVVLKILHQSIYLSIYLSLYLSICMGEKGRPPADKREKGKRRTRYFCPNLTRHTRPRVRTHERNETISRLDSPPPTSGVLAIFWILDCTRFSFILSHRMTLPPVSIISPNPSPLSQWVRHSRPNRERGTILEAKEIAPSLKLSE